MVPRLPQGHHSLCGLLSRCHLNLNGPIATSGATAARDMEQPLSPGARDIALGASDISILHHHRVELLPH